MKDRKLRAAAGDVFKQLQDKAVVENVYNDPAKSKQMPGVAATINGQKITVRELAEECIDRHGNDVLEGTINRQLLEQALRKKNLKIGRRRHRRRNRPRRGGDGQDQGRRRARRRGLARAVTKNQNISREVYVRDEVWPSVALKKLVGDNVQITEKT